MARTITQEQYQKVIESGADYCQCCGGLYEVAGLAEDPEMMPDPEDTDTLLSGFIVCRQCANHCDQGACQPDNLVEVVQ